MGRFLAKVVSGRQRLGVPTAILAVVPPLLATANTGLILLIGGLKVVAGGISIGLLIAFQGLLSRCPARSPRSPTSASRCRTSRPT